MEFIDTNAAAVRFGQAFRYWPYDTLPPESFLIPGYALSEDTHGPVKGTCEDLSDAAMRPAPCCKPFRSRLRSSRRQIRRLARH